MDASTSEQNEYTFPFNTCERVRQHGVAQPYSALCNFINCLIILYFLLHTKTVHTFLLLFSILCFEAFHTFSHIVHIEGTIQINVTHSLTYCMNLAFLYAFYCYTHVCPDVVFILYLIFLVFVDVYSLFYLTIIYYLTAQSLIFISLLVYYYTLLPRNVQQGIYVISFLVVLVIVLFLNEKWNCRNMMNAWPWFPFHILIEVVGVILFYVICQCMYNLSSVSDLPGNVVAPSKNVYDNRV